MSDNDVDYPFAVAVFDDSNTTVVHGEPFNEQAQPREIEMSVLQNESNNVQPLTLTPTPTRSPQEPEPEVREEDREEASVNSDPPVVRYSLFRRLFRRLRAPVQGDDSTSTNALPVGSVVWLEDWLDHLLEERWASTAVRSNQSEPAPNPQNVLFDVEDMIEQGTVDSSLSMPPSLSLSSSSSPSRHSFLRVLGFAGIFLVGFFAGTTINNINNNNTDHTVAQFYRSLAVTTRADVTDSETLSPQKKAFVWVILSYLTNTGGISSYVDVGKRMNQRFALSTLYFATTMGDDWTNHTGWLEDNVHECDWYGITCNKDGLIQIIDLGKNGLNGTLPLELSLLAPSLEKLILWGNALSGTIPSEYGDLSQLTYFDIGFNSLTGTIPITLGSLTNLEHFGLYNNDVGGSIPTELFLLPNLKNLILGKNPLTGTIPTEIGFATSLHGFYLYENKKLTGSIPTELGLLSDNLVMLGIAGLSLNGKIPSQLGALTKLESLDLNGNNLMGQIPTSIAQLVNLKTLELYNNQLSGTILTQIGFMTKLESLSLWHNNLTGPIPTELGMLSKLQQLDLSDNKLNGRIPSELSNLSALRALWIRNNALYGTLPELGRLTQLMNLDLSQNKLHGSISTEVGNLISLQNLWLQSNVLSGMMPSQLGELTQLKNLDLSNNQLSGVIPTALVHLIPNLQYLCLQMNKKLSVPKQPKELNKLNLSECNNFETQAH